MADENDPQCNPEDVQLQMRAAVERIRKTFNLMLNKELERDEENEKASGASAAADSDG